MQVSVHTCNIATKSYSLTSLWNAFGTEVLWMPFIETVFIEIRRSFWS